jgi:ABC-type multidrug transport system ATPase subunit
VVVTHDLDVAERLLDRVAVLKDGRLVAFDAARGRIREHYRTHVASRGNPEFSIQNPEDRREKTEGGLVPPKPEGEGG